MAPTFRLFFIATSIAFLSITLSLAKGSTSIPLYQLLFSSDNPSHAIFFTLRLPRTLCAFASGGLLALAGVLMQLLLQNPLADPYILGVSSGAALMTLCMMLLGLTANGLLLGAWLGSLLIILLILLLGKRNAWHAQTLLLIGIALASSCAAGITFILLLSPAIQTQSMLFWLAGDLNETQIPWFALIVLSIGTLICWGLAPGLNIFSRGDKEAQALGLSSKKYRLLLYLLSSLFTATAVTLSGCIGFIGLVIPHLTRLIAGFNHRLVIPLAVLLGGSLLTFADMLARTLWAPQQLPVGMIMILIGVPIFIGLLNR